VAQPLFVHPPEQLLPSELKHGFGVGVANKQKLPHCILDNLICNPGGPNLLVSKDNIP
jgi:hypothetical protein